jgi:hypothetical protein
LGTVPSIFTEYVRSLEPGRRAWDEKSFADLWAALRAALVGEMKRRGLWNTPPPYLGVYGGRTWAEARDGLEDLLADCYTFIFVDRLRSLKEQLRIKANIDGLVTLNLRHFLHDTQKKYDPLGYRVFVVLHAAVVELIGQGILQVVSGPARVRNDTILGFSPHDGGEAVAPPSLEHVMEWAGDLFLDDVRGEALRAVVRRAGEHLLALREAGLGRFRFGDVVKAAKHEVRARWRDSLAEGAGTEIVVDEAPSRWLHVLTAQAAIDERESFDELLASVAARIAARDLPDPTKDQLRRLLALLASWADLGELRAPLAASRESAAAIERTRSDDDVPSQRRMATLLGVSRSRVAELYLTLREVVGECEAARRNGRVAAPVGVGEVESP